MPLFEFDEESFSKSLSATHITPEIHEQHNEIQPQGYFGYTPQEDDLQDDDVLMDKIRGSPADLGVPKRRRHSSIYSRVSVRSGQPNQLEIPGDYDNSIHEHKRGLKDFIPLKVLGQGAYGKVYLVQDINTGKLFAQKQLRKPTISIQEDVHSKHVARTLSEREILTSITHHPNVVKLFYAFHDNDKFYLILEYIPGGELFHHLTAQSNSLGNVFKEDDVSFYAAQMALALKHLHELGIVYRDLKPENCLLNSEGNLVLTDFGLSKTINEEDDDLCSSIIGTPEYMAPEVLKGEEYSFGVDWWSLGCVIYDMMSGKPPFTGNSHKVVQDKIIKNKLKIPYYFSMDAKDLLNKLLNKNPEKRFSVDTKWKEFQSHRFFRKIQWSEMEKQNLRPPIVPVITDPRLAENFSSEFTDMKLSLVDNEFSFKEPNDFTGFSYTASSSYLDKYIQQRQD